MQGSSFIGITRLATGIMDKVLVDTFMEIGEHQFDALAQLSQALEGMAQKCQQYPLLADPMWEMLEELLSTLGIGLPINYLDQKKKLLTNKNNALQSCDAIQIDKIEEDYQQQLSQLRIEKHQGISVRDILHMSLQDFITPNQPESPYFDLRKNFASRLGMEIVEPNVRLRERKADESKYEYEIKVEFNQKMTHEYPKHKKSEQDAQAYMQKELIPLMKLYRIHTANKVYTMVTTKLEGLLQKQEQQKDYKLNSDYNTIALISAMKDYIGQLNMLSGLVFAGLKTIKGVVDNIVGVNAVQKKASFAEEFVEATASKVINQLKSELHPLAECKKHFNIQLAQLKKTTALEIDTTLANQFTQKDYLAYLQPLDLTPINQQIEVETLSFLDLIKIINQQKGFMELPKKLSQIYRLLSAKRTTAIFVDPDESTPQTFINVLLDEIMREDYELLMKYQSGLKTLLEHSVLTDEKKEEYSFFVAEIALFQKKEIELLSKFSDVTNQYEHLRKHFKIVQKNHSKTQVEITALKIDETEITLKIEQIKKNQAEKDSKNFSKITEAEQIEHKRINAKYSKKIDKSNTDLNKELDNKIALIKKTKLSDDKTAAQEFERKKKKLIKKHYKMKFGILRAKIASESELKVFYDKKTDYELLKDAKAINAEFKSLLIKIEQQSDLEIQNELTAHDKKVSKSIQLLEERKEKSFLKSQASFTRLRAELNEMTQKNKQEIQTQIANYTQSCQKVKETISKEQKEMLRLRSDMERISSEIYQGIDDFNRQKLAFREELNRFLERIAACTTFDEPHLTHLTTLVKSISGTHKKLELLLSNANPILEQLELHQQVNYDAVINHVLADPQIKMGLKSHSENFFETAKDKMLFASAPLLINSLQSEKLKTLGLSLATLGHTLQGEMQFHADQKRINEAYVALKPTLDPHVDEMDLSDGDLFFAGSSTEEELSADGVSSDEESYGFFNAIASTLNWLTATRSQPVQRRMPMRQPSMSSDGYEPNEYAPERFKHIEPRKQHDVMKKPQLNETESLKAFLDSGNFQKSAILFKPKLRKHQFCKKYEQQKEFMVKEIVSFTPMKDANIKQPKINPQAKSTILPNELVEEFSKVKISKSIP